ncbi:MAG TPA: alpha/beta fold hydrolase [Friedmanniella sp.]
MTHFVLVPGANHGGWWFAPVVEALSALGHRATAVTLSGLDPDGPPAPGANLDRHVEELTALVAAQPGPVVLVGHSYGGSVVTGAADADPERVAALVYLDAFVPDDGDSCYTLTNDWQREWYLTGAAATGVDVEPLPFFDPRARPHPLGTLLQRSRLTGAWRSVARKLYAAAADPEWLTQSPFVPTAARLRDDPAWSVVDLPVSHNVLRDGPDLLVELLRDLGRAPRLEAGGSLAG